MFSNGLVTWHTKVCPYDRSQKKKKKGVSGGFSPGTEVIKLFSFSAQLKLKFILLINVKMPTIVGILTFMSRINCRFLCFNH